MISLSDQTNDEMFQFCVFFQQFLYIVNLVFLSNLHYKCCIQQLNHTSFDLYSLAVEIVFMLIDNCEQPLTMDETRL